MGIEPIPNHEDRPWDLTAQLTEERGHSRAIDGTIQVEAETQPDASTAPAHDQRGDHRELLVVPGTLQQYGSLAARTPRAPQERRHQQRALIHKHDTGF